MSNEERIQNLEAAKDLIIEAQIIIFKNIE